MEVLGVQYHKRDFWAKENLNYAKPHFRMEKAARIVNRITQGRECDLLDVGCGPATLQHLLQKNIRYYGIDIAIHSPAPCLLQLDFLETPIKFADKKFDTIVAQGVFEYVGTFQSQKLGEISQLLKRDGRFVVSYVNFSHCNKQIYWPYSNVQSAISFRKSLEQYFRVHRVIPTSYRWFHDEPKGRFMKAIQMRIKINIPVVSRLFAVEYFFICSAVNSKIIVNRSK